MSAPRLMGAAFAALLASAAPALAQDMAVINARLVIGDGTPPIDNGTVVVRGGKVVAAGAGVAVPADLKPIDVGGRWVTPGLVVAVTDLGLVDVEAVDDSNDSDARKAPFSAGLDIAAAINPAAQPIAIARAGGVTRAAVAPLGTSGIFRGQGAVIDLGADPRAVVQPRAFQYVDLGEAGAQVAGGSRVAVLAELRNALLEARELSLAPAGTRRDDVLLTRTDAAALIPVVTGRQPLYVRADRAADIRMALALRTEFPALKLTLVGATEGWIVASEIAAAGVPVLLNPTSNIPSSFDLLGASLRNAAILHRAGVVIAISGNDAGHRVRDMRYNAGLAVSRGLPQAAGLEAITLAPARIFGVADQLGSIEPGKVADLAIWDGDPLEALSEPVAVYVSGKAQPMESRGTQLGQRYAKRPD